jgi:hypothetical protein
MPYKRRALPYAIAVRMNPLLRRAVAGIRQWQPFAPGLEAAETSYSAHGWNAPRRLVVVRELLRERPEARGRKLLRITGLPIIIAGLISIRSVVIAIPRTHDDSARRSPPTTHSRRSGDLAVSTLARACSSAWTARRCQIRSWKPPRGTKSSCVPV